MTERHEGGLSTADLVNAGQPRNAQPAPAPENDPVQSDLEPGTARGSCRASDDPS